MGVRWDKKETATHNFKSNTNTAFSLGISRLVVPWAGLKGMKLSQGWWVSQDLRQHECKRKSLLRRVFSETALFTGVGGGGQGLYKPWEVGRGFQGECTSLAEAEVLGTIICKEELQVLAGHVLLRREV